MTKGRHKNTLLRIQHVCEIVQKHYEPGRQDRCYRAVWRQYVYPVYPMCYRTFLNYLNVPTGELADKSDKQLSLFD